MQNLIKVLALVLFLALYGRNGPANPKESTEGSRDPTPAATPVTVPQQTGGPRLANNGTSKESEHEPKPVRVVAVPSKDFYDYTVFFANLCLVGVGFWGIIVALRSVKAAEKSARASLMQAKHTATSERAWLICKMENPSIPTDGLFTFCGTPTLKNHGNSPAFIFEIGNSAVILNKGELLPQVAIYEDKNIFRFEGRGIPVAPDGQVGRYLMSSCFEKPDDVLNDKRILWVYGYAKYRTVFSDKVRLTRYCFRCSTSLMPGYLPHTFVIDGPSAYNQAD